MESGAGDQWNVLQVISGMCFAGDQWNVLQVISGKWCR